MRDEMTQKQHEIVKERKIIQTKQDDIKDTNGIFPKSSC